MLFSFKTNELAKLSIPNFPGATKYLFWMKGGDLPKNIPLKANPREQDTDRPVYQKIIESFKDTKDLSFHVKNSGITILASKVIQETSTSLSVEIPENQGIVNGGHTTYISTKYCEENPEQLVPVVALVGLPDSMIPILAESLNTSTVVPKSSLAHLAGLCDPLKEVLAGQKAMSYIEWKQNQDGTTSDIKHIVKLLYMTHPNEKCSSRPHWPVTQAQQVYERGFYQESSQLRELLLKNRFLLPDYIELYKFVADLSHKKFIGNNKLKEKKASEIRTQIREKKEWACFQYTSTLLYDAPDALSKPRPQLRDAYICIIMSGISALTIEAEDGTVSWRPGVHRGVVEKIISSRYNDLLERIKSQLKLDRWDNQKTPKNDNLYALIRSAIKDEYQNF